MEVSLADGNCRVGTDHQRSATELPNPFNPETMINFDLSGDQVVSLTIYDIAGQVVRTLVDSQPMTVGSYKQMWDGRNDSGAKVGSGIYFYQLRAGDFIAKKKMTLLQ